MCSFGGYVSSISSRQDCRDGVRSVSTTHHRHPWWLISTSVFCSSDVGGGVPSIDESDHHQIQVLSQGSVNTEEHSEVVARRTLPPIYPYWSTREQERVYYQALLDQSNQRWSKRIPQTHKLHSSSPVVLERSHLDRFKRERLCMTPQTPVLLVVVLNCTYATTASIGWSFRLGSYTNTVLRYELRRTRLELAISVLTSGLCRSLVCGENKANTNRNGWME